MKSSYTQTGTAYGTHTKYKVSCTIVYATGYKSSTTGGTTAGTGGTTGTGNSFDTAIRLTLGSPAPVSVSVAGKPQYYVFTPAVSGTYSFTSSESKSDARSGFAELYDSNRKKIAENHEGGGLPKDYETSKFRYCFKIVRALSAGQTYFLTVTFQYNTPKGAHVTGTCKLTVTKDYDKSIAPGGASFEDALPFAAGEQVIVPTGLLNQVQYYSFTPKESGTYRFKSADATRFPYGTLYGPDRALITKNHASTQTREFIITRTLSAGKKYYLGVSYNMGDQFTGDLKLSVEKWNPSRAPFNSAQKMSLKTPVSVPFTGTMCQEFITERYYAFTPEKSGLYTFFSGEGGIVSWSSSYCVLYDSDLNALCDWSGWLCSGAALVQTLTAGRTL
jgi:hypothetical protein